MVQWIFYVLKTCLYDLQVGIIWFLNNLHLLWFLNPLCHHESLNFLPMALLALCIIMQKLHHLAWFPCHNEIFWLVSICQNGFYALRYSVDTQDKNLSPKLNPWITLYNHDHSTRSNAFSWSINNTTASSSVSWRISSINLMFSPINLPLMLLVLICVNDAR